MSTPLGPAGDAGTPPAGGHVAGQVSRFVSRAHIADDQKRIAAKKAAKSGGSDG